MIHASLPSLLHLSDRGVGGFCCVANKIYLIPLIPLSPPLPAQALLIPTPHW